MYFVCSSVCISHSSFTCISLYLYRENEACTQRPAARLFVATVAAATFFESVFLFFLFVFLVFPFLVFVRGFLPQLLQLQAFFIVYLFVLLFVFLVFLLLVFV